MTTRRTDLTHVPQFWCLRTVGWPLLALLIALGGWFADRASPSVATSGSESGSTDVPVSAAFQGVTGKGDLFICQVSERTPVQKFCVLFTTERR